MNHQYQLNNIYYFLKAIHNKTADSNNDGILTIQEIDDFVSDRNEGVFYKAKRLHGVEQTPTLEGTNKDRVLVRY